MIAAYILALMIWAQEPSQPPYFTAWTVDVLRHEIVGTVADTWLGPTPAPEPVDAPAARPALQPKPSCFQAEHPEGDHCVTKDGRKVPDLNKFTRPNGKPAMHCGPALVWPTDDLSDEAGQRVRICFMEDK